MPHFVLFWNRFLLPHSSFYNKQNISKDFNLFRRDNLNIILITVVSSTWAFDLFFFIFIFFSSLSQM